MKTTILKQSLILLSSATLLAACGGDGGDSPVDDFGSNPGESGAQALLYAYPDNGQGEVPTKAPIALRFTSAVSLGNVNQSVTLCCDENGADLDFTSEKVPGEPRGVLLTPTQPLMPQNEYTVEISDLRLNKGTAKDQTLTFKTRPLQEGPKSLVAESQDFVVDRQFPNGSELEPYMDFSSFRFQFTQPIDGATATYGDGNSVVLRDSEGMEVDAGLLVDGAYMTVDPTDDYLKPGETYTLTLGAGLMSTYGESFDEQTIEFTPKDSSPRGEPGFLVQKITQSGTSRLTGKAINQVPVNGTLLGDNANVTQAQSDFVIAELADVTQYTEVTPIRLPKGTLLEGTPIETVLIGGEVDAGFGSGAVTMRILSDATGYLVPNPYTDHQDNLRIVHLFMDVGIATENAKANGGFTQNLLHIHLVGVAEVDPNGGVLNIDATSMVEPDVLGLEYGHGLLSFQLQSYKEQTDSLLADARAAKEDAIGPVLQSWVPGDNTDLAKPGQPIILNFDEPLDPESIEGNVTFTENGTPIGADVTVDGAALVIRPDEPLRYSPENSPLVYRVQLSSDISDVAGNELAAAFDETFELPVLVENVDVFGDGSRRDPIAEAAPVVLATYPGFPCALDPSSRDLANGWSGRCAGGMPGIFEGYENDHRETDDLIPVSELSADRPIIVQFHKDIDPNSVQLGSSFQVERIDQDGNVQESVPGHLIKEPRRLMFWPAQGWQEGELYKYTLASGGYQIIQGSGGWGLQLIDGSDYSCDGSDAICGNDGLPLHTQPLGAGEIAEWSYDPDLDPPPAGETYQPGSYRSRVIAKRAPNTTAGGPDMIQYFSGAPADRVTVLQSLAAAPVADTNGNFFMDRNLDENFPTINFDFDYFGEQEPGPTQEPDSYTEDLVDVDGTPLDPNGVRPALNSSKILMQRREDSFPIWDSSVSVHDQRIVPSINIGCGHKDPISDTANPQKHECPEHKFIYLHSGLFAEVTREYDPNKGLKVLIWPSQILTTSADLAPIVDLAQNDPSQPFSGLNYPVPPAGFLATEEPGYTGPQILRMRYADSDNDGQRREPVEGWIQESGDTGELMLSATLDLYLDAPSLVDRGLTVQNGSTNLNSYPLTMELSGPVTFLDDGRMVVEQYNLEQKTVPVEVHLRGNLNVIQNLIIPKRGNRVQYISDPIKR